MKLIAGLLLATTLAGTLKPAQKQTSAHPFGKIEGFRRVEDSERDWPSLEAAITAAYRIDARRVAAEYSRFNDSRLAVIGSDAFAQRRITVESLMRPRSDAAPVVYYFEAAQRPNDDQDIGIAVRGWVSKQTDGNWKTFATSGRLAGGDGPPVPMSEPIGLVRLNGHVYWFSSVVGYESLGYVVYEITTDRARQIVTADGGGC